MSPNHLSEEDFAELARWNVNVIRWQLTRNWGAWDAGKSTDQDLAEYDSWLDGRLADVDKMLVLAKRHGIRAVIDLHSPPGGRTKDGTMLMTQEARFQDHFVKVWERMAKRYKGNPAVWAYDLINEPTQNRPSPAGVGDWLGMQVRAAKAVRAIDAQTPIMITVDGWGGPTNFGWLAAVDVPRIIYQVHMYEPGSYTHQGVHGAMPDPLRTYPGMIDNRMADKEALRRVLQPVRDFQRAYNVHIYVGEFSAIRWAPGADRYLADCVDLFEEYGWDWSYHAFREWPGWSIEYAEAPADKSRHEKAVGDTARGKVLKGWWAKNKRTPE
jgi:aryl-phospho-beta-D-glucosidase BglC (GH1 family)